MTSTKSLTLSVLILTLIIGITIFIICAKTKLSEQAQRELDSEMIDLAWQDDSAPIKELLEKGANANADIKGYTALMGAAKIGNLRVVNILISKGANVNAKTPMGETALKLASQYGQSNVVQVLKSAGAQE